MFAKELTQQEELLLSQVERTRRDENCQDQAQEQVQQQAQRAVQPAMVNANGTGDAMSHAQISTLEVCRESGILKYPQTECLGFLVIG